MPRCGWCGHYCDLRVRDLRAGVDKLVGVCVVERDGGDLDGDIWEHGAYDEACGAWVPYDPEDPECWEED